MKLFDSGVPSQLGLSEKQKAERRTELLQMEEQRRKDARAIGATMCNAFCSAIFCLSLAFGGFRQVVVALIFWLPFMVLFWKWVVPNEQVPTGEGGATGGDHEHMHRDRK